MKRRKILTKICPHCGAPMQAPFFGVRLRRRQAEILTIIVRFDRQQIGCPTIYLAELFYPDKDPLVGMQAIRVHVNQINDRLAETDYQVRNDKNGYRIIAHGLV